MKLENGSVLIEVVFVIAMVVSAAIIYSINATINRVVRNEKFTVIASNIANAKIDDLREKGYDLLPPSGSFYDNSISNLPNATSSFEVIGQSGDLKEISVIVEWQESEKEKQSVNFATYITPIGGL